ncbi:RNA polymerase sigma factor [Streptomyces sp. NPDC056202]|uniref:RNA polymerase sigma factor n=1 Tax=unclassified Streptomyces TaxID=2593676 RepID=UPI0035DE5CCC
MTDPFGKEPDLVDPDPGQPRIDPRGEQFFRDNLETFMGIAVYKLRSPHDADDAVMIAVEAMHKKIERILAHPNPIALAMTILNHTIIDYMRVSARMNARECLVREVPATTYLMDLGRYDRLDRAMEALEATAPTQAACLVLYDLIGLSYTQIAHTLGVTPGAAKTNVSRGRKQLETLMLTELPKEKGDS